ncbi:hypothetical protein AVEN_76304-1 [Araneus ventricosus]|uniref:Uncharacterized protein n=1 Tax=Araneus ventricosus TaxID=182803 RepID=A0A4Y2M2Z9_ARAVE|nr:hypothetical protein AVEN_76304-1 [Araneus ventricosus]
MAGLSSLISPLNVPLMTTRPTAFAPLSEQQPAEIRPTSIEVAWPVAASLGVKVLTCYTHPRTENVFSVESGLEPEVLQAQSRVLNTRPPKP